MYCQRKLLLSCNTITNALLQETVEKKHGIFHTKKNMQLDENKYKWNSQKINCVVTTDIDATVP